jgi:hypothetical protein
MRLPRTLSSVAVLVACYALAMIAAALWLPHEWDWAAWNVLGAGHAPTFDRDEIAIVDVPWTLADLSVDRRRIAGVLDDIVARKARPAAVVLDVQFGPCQTSPCQGTMAVAKTALIGAIRAAETIAPVYALEQPELDGSDTPTSLDAHDDDIYVALSGAAHTRFTKLASGGRFYRACYDVPVRDPSGAILAREHVWDMVERVAMRPEVFANAACDDDHVAVRLPGDPVAPAAAAVIAASSRGTLPADARLDGKFVIIGTLAADRQDPALPGPELLAWALGDALDRESGAGAERAYDTEPQGTMLALLVPAFSVFGVIAFVAVFYLLKGARLRALRPALPWLSAAGGATIGLAAFAAFEACLLAGGHVQPQVTLIALGIVLACALASLRAYQYLFDQTWTIESVPTETYDYDVFVSYAHDEGAWVFEHVYAPLRDARLPDGRKLNIFFDTSTIRYGTAWQEKITLSIEGSRIVVPVYSDTYFSRPYCKFEIMRAHLKWIKAGTESRCVLPIARGRPKIPATVSDIQSASLEDVPELVSVVVAEIVERISRLTQPDRQHAVKEASFFSPRPNP